MTTPLDALVTELRRQRISEVIIERVIRLNPDYDPGRFVRGIHLSSVERRRMFWLHGSVSRNEFVRRYGREVFARLPKAVILRCGRRIYVSHEAEMHL